MRKKDKKDKKDIGERLRPLTSKDIHKVQETDSQSRLAWRTGFFTGCRFVINSSSEMKWLRKLMCNDRVQSFVGWVLIAGCVGLIIYTIIWYFNYLRSLS